MAKVSLIFDDETNWTIQGTGKIGGMDLIKGNVTASGLALEVKTLNSSGSFTRSLDIHTTTLTGLQQSNLSSDGLTFLSENTFIELSVV